MDDVEKDRPYCKSGCEKLEVKVRNRVELRAVVRDAKVHFGL